MIRPPFLLLETSLWGWLISSTSSDLFLVLFLLTLLEHLTVLFIFSFKVSLTWFSGYEVMRFFLIPSPATPLSFQLPSSSSCPQCNFFRGSASPLWLPKPILSTRVFITLLYLCQLPWSFSKAPASHYLPLQKSLGVSNWISLLYSAFSLSNT